MRLSKSKIGDYDLCSWKYKLKYIDNIPEPPTPYAIYAQEGKDFHEGVVNFFTQLNPFKKQLDIYEIRQIMATKDEYVLNFINKFVKPVLLKSCKNNPKYYFPILQEEKIYNEEYDFAGIVDSVFINPKDNRYIIVDWKTGKFKPKYEIRKELAYYKLLLDGSGLLDKPVKYYSMFFVKIGRLFFEEIDDRIVDYVIKKIRLVRQRIKKGEFEKGKGCHFCGYKIGEVCNGKK